MKLSVTGVETIEATDPKGISHQAQPTQVPKEVGTVAPPWEEQIAPAPTASPPPTSAPTTQPDWATPMNPITLPRRPITDVPMKPTIYQKNIGKTEKWTKNMQMSGAAKQMENKDGDHSRTYSA